MVNIQDLSLAFGKQVLFKHLDLTLLPNEWVSLLGCSGGQIQGNIISVPDL